MSPNDTESSDTGGTDADTNGPEERSETDGSRSDGGEVRRRVRSIVAAATRSYVVIVALAIVVGLVVAPFAWGFGAGTTETVAVVPLAGSIDGENAADVTERLAEARNDPSVEAVVLVVDSPGGEASASEELYMEIARTAETMPVTAVVGTIAASGAYYAIAPADEIYVKPSSTVGSVGVFLMMPEQVDPLDEVIESGPDKLSGQTERGWTYQADTIQNAFVETVLAERGDDLELERTELERASVYPGVDAVDLGLADDFGDAQDAIQGAADMAGLEGYAVTELQYDTEIRFVSTTAYGAADVPEKRLVSPSYYASTDDGMAAILMFPRGIVASAAQDDANATTDAAVLAAGGENA